MKVVKIKKKYYRDLEFMYKDLGLIEEDENGEKSVNPSNVLMSDVDTKILKKTIAQEFKKKYPFCRSIKLQSSIKMYLLNLEPSTVAGKAIKPGYLVIL
jgi:hypothetical protein